MKFKSSNFRQFPSLTDPNFKVEYFLGESLINNKTETFAIILNKLSQEASIWNCNSNTFYCNHKHNLKDLKNWIEYEKEKNNDICPNCCN